MANRILQTIFKIKNKDMSEDEVYFMTSSKNVYTDNNGTTLYSKIQKISNVVENANVVEKSNQNGYIKIDGVETKVYEHPQTLVSPVNRDAGSFQIDEFGHIKSGSFSTWSNTCTGIITDGKITIPSNLVADRNSVLPSNGSKLKDFIIHFIKIAKSFGKIFYLNELDDIHYKTILQKLENSVRFRNVEHAAIASEKDAYYVRELNRLKEENRIEDRTIVGIYNLNRFFTYDYHIISLLRQNVDSTIFKRGVDFVWIQNSLNGICLNMRTEFELSVRNGEIVPAGDHFSFKFGIVLQSMTTNDKLVIAEKTFVLHGGNAARTRVNIDEVFVVDTILIGKPRIALMPSIEIIHIPDQWGFPSQNIFKAETPSNNFFMSITRLY